MNKLISTSKILYVRAAIAKFAAPIKTEGGLLPFLKKYIDFDELFVPHFYGARPFWRKPPLSWPPQTNSGALGKLVRKLPGAVLSDHPTNAFVGIGYNVEQSFAVHNATAPCFAPLEYLANRHDFSMLLLGCLDESPGFSTVHVAQQLLGLSQRHFLRLILRWDIFSDGNLSSIMAPEAPGCSASFDKFYPHYEADGNLIRGEWYGERWIFIPSARRALNTEIRLLQSSGRFVECGRWDCLTCRLRLY